MGVRVEMIVDDAEQAVGFATEFTEAEQEPSYDVTWRPARAGRRRWRGKGYPTPGAAVAALVDHIDAGQAPERRALRGHRRDRRTSRRVASAPRRS